MKAIVLAGGEGIRLWPLSKSSFPKQFLKLWSSFSLLQITVIRLLKAPFITQVIVLTNARYRDLVEKHLKKIDPEQRVKIVLEPCRKNTAPAVGLALKYFENAGEDEDVYIVLPSDHLIEPASLFLDSLSAVESFAREGCIVTFGICPNRAETGYGYVQIGKELSKKVYKAMQFVEKPELDLAEKFFQDPSFYWNSGIFVFSSKTFWEELKKTSFLTYSLFQASYFDVLDCFEEMPNISLDYAIMEKSDKIVTYPLIDVNWSDVGSWDSVYEVLEKDENQNVKRGNVHTIDTKNCLLLGGKRVIATVGLENLLIVETPQAIFIGEKGKSQDLKKLIDQLG